MHGPNDAPRLDYPARVMWRSKDPLTCPRLARFGVMRTLSRRTMPCLRNSEQLSRREQPCCPLAYTMSATRRDAVSASYQGVSIHTYTHIHRWSLHWAVVASTRSPDASAASGGYFCYAAEGIGVASFSRRKASKISASKEYRRECGDACVLRLRR